MAAVLTGPYGGGEDTDTQYPLLGETLGLWRLLRGVGKGGMGEVYEAEYDFIHLLSMRHEPTQRGVIRQELHALPRAEQAKLASDLLGMNLLPDARFAVKVCNARTGTAGFKRFIQEAELAKRLGSHPAIVTVHYIHNCEDDRGSNPEQLDLGQGRHSDVAYMVMDLAVRNYDVHRLAIEDAVSMVRAMATALDHAHEHGVVHRDLKPENILGGVDEPLLTDFGIAKEVDQSLGLTRTGQIIGTLDYMSPEQATDAKHVDLRSDIYSLGVVLFEFATRGCLPYYHISERESCLAAIRTEKTEPRWPRLYDPHFPAGLEYIILKAMAYNRDERYQQMSEFIGDLDRFTRGEWISPYRRVRPRRFVWHYRAQHPKLFVYAPIVGVALLVLVLLVLLPPMLDSRRRSMTNQITQLESYVDKTGDLFGDEQIKLVESLEGFFASFPDEYPALSERFETLIGVYYDKRFLRADFTGSKSFESIERLRLAAGGEKQPWALQDGVQGLTMNADVSLVCAPYGSGLVYVRLEVESDDPIVLTVQGDGDASRRCVLKASASGVRFDFEEGESSERNLAFKPFYGGRYHLDVAIAVDAESARSYWPNSQKKEHPHAGVLKDGGSARVQLDLPQGAVLKVFEIWPRE